MLSPEINYLVQMEQRKDQLRALEQQQLLAAAPRQHAALTATYKGVARLGAWMIKWGTKLQAIERSPVAKTVVR